MASQLVPRNGSGQRIMPASHTGPAPPTQPLESPWELGVCTSPRPPGMRWDGAVGAWGCSQALTTWPMRSICQHVLVCQGGAASPDEDAAH